MNAKLETTKNVGSYYSNCDSESGKSAAQLKWDFSKKIYINVQIHYSLIGKGSSRIKEEWYP